MPLELGAALAPRIHEYGKTGLYFAEPELISVLLLFGFPAVLSGAGVLLLRRIGPASKLSVGYRRWYYFFVCLTSFALALTLISGVPALCMSSVKVRD